MKAMQVEVIDVSYTDEEVKGVYGPTAKNVGILYEIFAGDHKCGFVDL
jgi:hypothetical protein